MIHISSIYSCTTIIKNLYVKVNTHIYRKINILLFSVARRERNTL
jgi:hypothetical protein